MRQQKEHSSKNQTPSQIQVICRGAVRSMLIKKKERLANLNKAKKVEYRHILQDWQVWLSKQDSKGNEVNLQLENIYLDQLQEGGLLLYERLQRKFKNPLVGPENFYLQYKLESELYPINIELSQGKHALSAFKKFAELSQERYATFGPVLVLYCRGPLWTTPPCTGIVTSALKGRAAITRYLTDKYKDGKLSLGILDEMMTLGTASLKRAVHGIMPEAERHHHGYLLEKINSKVPSPEERFLSDSITLKAYEDIRYPEAKIAKEKRDADYPTAEEPHKCIVCGEVTATISCMECPNKVCRSCVRQKCLEKAECFLHFHHQHCLKFGRPYRHPLPELENMRQRGMPGKTLPGMKAGGGDGKKVKKTKPFRPPSGTINRPRHQNSQKV